MTCLAIDQLEQFLADELDEDSRLWVESHVAECDECRSQLAEVEANLRVVEHVRSEFAHSDGAEPKPFELPSDAFDGYEIAGEIHRGAQGIVYEAVQTATRRRVAIKILRQGPFAGSRDRARFEREVEVLGQLNHPSIVAIHDTGRAAGHDYFVMDFIDGQPLDRHLSAAGLSIEATLRLFLEICRAMEAAHLRGVIHRDLKPGNILIDSSGAPHICDFGLAKLADDGFVTGARSELMTMTGQFLGSLPWASPEQAAGTPERVDIRTDVYSLGVILHQMLTGRFPYEVTGNIRDVVDTIIHREPTSPRIVRREIDDEVETIVMRCLAKDPARRYQGAGELARDVSRYLAHEPIEAKRDSTWYVLRKTLRRHRGPAAVIVAFLVLIVGFSAVMAWLYRDARVAEAIAEAERTRATTEAATASQVSSFLIDLFRVADPSAGPTAHVTARELLDRGAQQVERELADQPEVRAAMRHVIGTAYLNLGLYDEAESLLSAALATRRRLLGDEHPSVADSLDRLAWVHIYREEHAQAEALFREALAIRETQLGRRHRSVAVTLNGLASTFTHRNRFADAEAHLNRALEIIRAEGDADPLAEVPTLDNLAALRQAEGDYVAAEAILREVLAVQREVHPGDHADIAGTLASLGSALYHNADLPSAIALKTEALAMYERLYGEVHPEIGLVLRKLAKSHSDLGEFDRALPYAQRAVEIARSTYGEAHPVVARSTDELGWVRYRQGEYERAEEHMLEALAMRRRLLDERHPDIGWSLNGLGAVNMDRGRLEEARRSFSEALEIIRHAYGEDHPETGTLCLNLAAALDDTDCARSEQLCRQALAIHVGLYGEDHPELLNALTKLAWSLHCGGKLDEAEATYLRALELGRKHLGEHPLIGFIHIGLSWVTNDRGRPEEAEAYAHRAMEIRRQFLPPEHWLQACADSTLGESLAAQERFEEAEPVLLESYRAMTAIRGSDSLPCRRAREHIVRMYEAWGRPERAEAFLADSGN